MLLREKPLLTVVVPVYDVEPYLCECVDSIRQQTYNNIEVILVDDGAKGREGIICDEYATLDTRIRVIHKENAGLIAARKTGIKAASAEYITFVDGDDFISADYYSKMMRIMVDEKPDILAVSFTQYYSKDKCEVVQQRMESGVYEGEALTHLLQNINCKNARWYEFSVFPSTCMKIYKAEKLKENALEIPENIRIGEDSAFSFPYMMSCKKIVVDNSITGYYYRVVKTSMVRNKDRNNIIEIDALYKYLKPFYERTKNDLVVQQLELYRVYLLNEILSGLMGNVKLTEIHKQTRFIQNTIEATAAFKNLKLGVINIPKDIAENLSSISNHKWTKFECKWLIKVLKARLIIVLRKVLIRR